MNVTNRVQEEAQQHQNSHANAASIENDEEPIVTSTSNDLSLSFSAYVQQQLQQQHNTVSVITSPARITSSTGNESTISSPLHQQQQVDSSRQQSQLQLQQHTTAATEKSRGECSSEGASRTQNTFASAILRDQQQQLQVDADDTTAVTPTTSEQIVSAKNSTPIPISISCSENSQLASIEPSTESNDMVARNSSAPTIAESSNCGNAIPENVAPTEASANHKIILKLPRPLAPATESQMDADPTTSNSSSSSSNNSSAGGGEDTRKVEPLKINLHSAHSAVVQPHNIPKITIKPIVKKQTEETDASCSSSADDDPPIPKLTIKAIPAVAQHSSSGSSSEPHIVPKLTIRSTSGEEGSGTPHSASILPRLTIKMSDSQSSQSGIQHNNMLSVPSCSSPITNVMQSPASMTSSACSTPSPPPQQPTEQAPLPKLTIKTSIDGTSNSIISNLSPVSLSSSSTSSSSPASAPSSSLPTSTVSVPKLTIKSIQKPDELLVPKLTIKTNAAGNSECASTSTISAVSEALDDAAENKIPKLTIKTGQEHAVIITQHSSAPHAQSIPKMTIKTKSLDAGDAAASSSQTDHSDEPPEKIPKITIINNEILDKAVDSPKFCIKNTQSTEAPAQQQQPTIPKLTITVSTSEGGGSGVVTACGAERGPHSPLIVRQLPGISRKLGAATSSSSPERVPKLMISRQDSGFSNPMLVISNHSNDTAATDNKVVPKLTIKTNSLSDAAESKELKTAKFSIKNPKAVCEEEKVPKLTIKSVPKSVAPPTQQQSSEESDECVSLSSCSSPVAPSDDSVRASSTKVVPKLTIKNLSSPQPTVRTVVGVAPDGVMPASKKCAKNIESKNDISSAENENTEDTANPPPMMLNHVEETIDETFATITSVGDVRSTMMPTANGGESSSSQDFCGFNDNTTDSNLEATANLISLNMIAERNEEGNEEDPRRQSDDMDIDEALQQQHAPQVFNNVANFSSSNGGDAPATATAAADNQQSADTATMDGYFLPPLKHPKMTHVIDTVDLTSSPDSSPAHFDYADATETDASKASGEFYLERMQHREISVIQQATTVKAHSILLNKLTSQSPHPAPAAENRVDNQTRPALQMLQPKLENFAPNNSTRYPHLAERLMANGIVAHSNQAVHSHTHPNAAVKAAMPPPPANVIVDSIEILDTPDGSPQSSLDEAPIKLSKTHRMAASEILARNCKDVDTHNNNNSMLRANHGNLKRQVPKATRNMIQNINQLQHESLRISPNKLRRIENESGTMATITILTNDYQEPTATVITTSPTMIRSNHHCRDVNTEAAASASVAPPPQTTSLPPTPHRSRKQKHEHLLTMPDEEQDPLQLNSNDIAAAACAPSSGILFGAEVASAAAEVATPIVTVKKRGRPRKGTKPTTPASDAKPSQNSNCSQKAKEQLLVTPGEEKAVKSRLTRVQLLRKRLAIDMVDTEPSPSLFRSQQLSEFVDSDKAALSKATSAAAARRDRNLRTPLRASRRSATPNMLAADGHSVRKNNEITDGRKMHRKKSATEAKKAVGGTLYQHHQNFGISSNSSLSSCSAVSSLSSSTATTTAAVTMAGQIDLTLSSSSSSSSSNTVTTVEAGGGASRPTNSMLPPTTILSSSDPLADVIFRPNDFSSFVAAQQLRSPNKSRRTSAEDRNLVLTPAAARSRKGSRTDSQEDDGTGGSGADHSGDDSANYSSAITPGRGRGRGRGRSHGRGCAGGTRGTVRTPRLGRGASSVAKAIAMSRPRCIGGLKHTPDPERIKGLFSPAPQVFEEDTRMSADLNQTAHTPELTQTAVKQLDFLANEESQSSVISNTSILDPNTVAAVQNGAQIQKRPKKKKMEVCVSEDADFTVASIAEYEWPPPKGCCPSKHRDAFMIQEQVALYLGIKSFKRKYPDLPRRQVDMEERNWLQEKGLVSERMCDLGITAVWASDILDIMYTDFYDKYEEYKDFVRKKYLREIEAKQKALGTNIVGRGLQARDRAMLSASKWNSHFNKSRKEERKTCLDLQTLTLNVPLSSDAPVKIFANRPMVDAVAAAVKEAGITETPPALQQPALDISTSIQPHISYPLALVPGQFCEKYRRYTALELRSYPINTVLDDPRTLHDRLNHLFGSNQKVDEDTDTESATEATGTAIATALQLNEDSGTKCSPKRLPVRRSRRARTNALKSTPTKCDTKNEQDKGEQRNNYIKSESEDENSDTSTTSSSESSTSSSDTDSDSDLSCSSSNDQNNAKCGVCQRTQNRNLKNFPEVFLKCYTCRRKVHPSCIEMPTRMMMRARNYNWQCAECKCCIKCKQKQDQNKMLFCEQCDRGYHIYCIDVKTVPEGRWSCERCCVCMRCGATKPEGLPKDQMLLSPSGAPQQVKQVKHKKVKWINEYRLDHITKLREHSSMLCVQCGRAKPASKRNNQYGAGAVAVGGGVAITATSQISPALAEGVTSNTTTTS